MSTSFNPSQFLVPYNSWRDFQFPTENIDMDEVSNLKYDLYELEARLAGYWIRFAQSDFKETDKKVDNADAEVDTLIRQFTELREKANMNDIKVIDACLEYLNYLHKMIQIYNEAK